MIGVGIPLLRVVVAVAWLHIDLVGACGVALDIVVVSLVLSSLVASGVALTLVLATVVVLVALTLHTFVVETVSTTLSPSMVAMAWQWAGVRVLDPV